MKRFFFFSIFLFGVFQFLYSQGDVDSQQKIFYRDEISGAISLNSNGFGLDFRSAKRTDAAHKILFDYDFALLKHPKEYRISTTSVYGQMFVLGKQYVPFVFRASYGKQIEIFRKFDVGGISIRYFRTVGPSVALLKPIYYDYYNNSNYEEIVSRYDPDLLLNYTPVGRASFFKGFNELLIIPGAFLKLGFSFEYSKQDKVLHAIEVGAFAEGFLKKLPIMATTQNYQFYLSMFVSYRFGKVKDPTVKKDKKKKATKEDFFY